MKVRVVSIVLALILGIAGVQVQAQSSAQSISVPTIFQISGTLVTAGGQPRAGNHVLVASLYEQQEGGQALWSEQQAVAADQNGAYSIRVGITQDGGVPKQFLLSGAGRWLGIAVQGEAEQPRIMLVSVAYADRAIEADRLSGRSASDFVLAENLTSSLQSAISSSKVSFGTPTTSAAGTTANALAMYENSGGTLGSANVYDVGGKIGVGIANPLAKFHLKQTGVTALDGFRFDLPGAGTSDQSLRMYYDGTNWVMSPAYSSGGGLSGFSFTASVDGPSSFYLSTIGTMGLGTITPQAKFNIKQLGNTSTDGFRLDATSSNQSLNMYHDGTRWVVSPKFSSGGSLSPLLFTSSIGGENTLFLSVGGNVGIGTTSPTAKLDVAGSINVSGNINAKYQDVAETVESIETLEPGTVVIVDPNAVNKVLRSTKAYDTRIAGAVSRQPGLTLGEPGENKVLVAQMGRVRVKVDASYGAIKVGDLLVTSPTPGHAMKSKPIRVGGQLIHRTGTLLGKALEALPNGKGEILVLIAVQ
jgi:hypothetical protein